MAAPVTLAPRTLFDLEINFARRVLKPRGEIDAATTPMLLDAAKAFMTSSVGDLTIDLAQVTFAGSALLHTLDEIRGELGRQGAGLWIVNEPPCVVRLFRASGYGAAPMPS